MPKKDENYVFPDMMAKLMAKLDTRTQMEASMMSLIVILLGVIVMTFYTIFFTDLGIFPKVMVGINGIAGFVFLSSYLVTSFQQYQSYLLAQNIQFDLGGKDNGVAEEETEGISAEGGVL